MSKRVFRRWADDPGSLQRLLVARLGLGDADANELIGRGSVYVANDRAEGPDVLVPVGAKVTVHATQPPSLPPLFVIHRDADLAIVDKPAGLPSQPERGQRAHSLDAAVARQLGPDARPLHRLDKPVSGLVVVALRPGARAALQRTVAEHESHRRYLAIVAGRIVGEGAIKKRIGRHPRDQRLRAALPDDATAGQAATTRYRALAHGMLDGHEVTAVDVQLETGRTHQIRVHLASIGHPVLGDDAYGGPPYARLCLHAYAIELAHPANGRTIRASAPIPDELTRLVPGLTRPFT